MNEYQEFVAGKALALLRLMERIGHSNREVAELLKAMHPKLDCIARGEVVFPSSVIDGYALYFSPDAYNGIYERFPELVDAKADLSFALRRANMDAYVESCRQLGIPFDRPPVKRLQEKP